MGKVKNYMLIDPGDKIMWERHGQTYEGTVEYLTSCGHSMNGQAYVVSRKDGEVLKEYTVYPSEIALHKMITQRQDEMLRYTRMMKAEDLND